MFFNFIRATEPLQGDIILFTTESLGVIDAHLIDLGRMAGWFNLGTTQWF